MCYLHWARHRFSPGLASSLALAPALAWPWPALAPARPQLGSGPGLALGLLGPWPGPAPALALGPARPPPPPSPGWPLRRPVSGPSRGPRAGLAPSLARRSAAPAVDHGPAPARLGGPNGATPRPASRITPPDPILEGRTPALERRSAKRKLDICDTQTRPHHHDYIYRLIHLIMC